MKYDNPAARLHSLLTAGLNISRGTTCSQAWHELLKTSGSNPILLSRLGKVYEMPQLIVDALEEFDPGDAPEQHWQTQVMAGLTNQQLQQQWSTFINHIDSHTLTYLKIAAKLLSKSASHEPATQEQLAKFQQLLEDLLREILESDQPDSVKQYVVRSLRKLIISIEEYRLTGSIPVGDAIDAAIGHVAVDENYGSFLFKHPLGQKLRDCLGDIANVVTVYGGLPQLPSFAAGFLT